MCTAVLTFLCCLFGPVHASQPDFQLRGADARYRVVISGVPVGMEAIIQLSERKAEKAFDLNFHVDHALLSHRETSSFTWQGCQARPYAYRYDSAGFGIKRGGSVDFDWANLAAAGEQVFAITEDTLDAMSLAMVARCLLARNEQALEFIVAEPDGLKRVRYQVVGRETLKTPAGTYETIKVERVYTRKGRRTYMWAAVDLDYFMIRMDHIENPLVRGRIELTGFTWTDNPSDVQTAGQ